MNLELFIVFASLSVILAFLGYYTKPSIKVLAVIGFATLFFLGLLLQFGGVTQKTGSSVVADGPDFAISYSYQTIDDSTSVWIGRWLSIVSALSVALVFSSNKEDD